eukprot:5949870-Amphidinium_carterae.1
MAKRPRFPMPSQGFWHRRLRRDLRDVWPVLVGMRIVNKSSRNAPLVIVQIVNESTRSAPL